MLQPVNSVCIWKHVWRQRDRNFLISSHSDWLLCTKCNGLKAYHHCGERIISLHWGFHGSCSLNSQICFFTSFPSLLNTFFMRTHTVTLWAGVCLGPTWLLPSWVLFQFDADGLKQSEEDYEIRFRSEGEPQHCLTLSLRSAGRLTAISEASAAWIESLLSASANPLLHLINHELGHPTHHTNTTKKLKREEKCVCPSKIPLEDVQSQPVCTGYNRTRWTDVS